MFPARARTTGRRTTMAAAAVAAITASLLLSMPLSATADVPVAEATDGWSALDALPSDATLDPANYSAFTLDVDSFAAALGDEGTAPSSGTAQVLIPDPGGSLVSFAVSAVQLMDPALAAEHPELQAFTGTAVDDPALTLRADLTPAGLHAMVRDSSDQGRSWYVDPASQDDASTYASYPAGALPEEPAADGDDHRADEDDAPTVPSDLPTPDTERRPDAAESDTVGVRTVRVAMLSDPTFAAFYGTDKVLAAKFTILNRAAEIYLVDTQIKLVMADGTDQLNFDTDERTYDANGPCGADACFSRGALDRCNGDNLGATGTVIQQLIGNENYDLGHTLLANDGGGVGAWNVVGAEWYKGMGCSGMHEPVGDRFSVDYVAHELGHQFGAEHTMQSCYPGAQLIGGQAYEPGSGTTIMGYAGVCGGNDLQRNTDPYFSQASIAQITAGSVTNLPAEPTDNHAPTVQAPESKTLPIQTPFSLTASGGDIDGDTVNYLWEQRNLGDLGRGLYDQGKVAGPLFRIFSKATQVASWLDHAPGENTVDGNPTRVFPDMDQILAGATNAQTGTCPDSLDGDRLRDCVSEFLPTSAYTGGDTDSLDFRVTGRDRRSAGGGVGSADVRLPLEQDAGPLLVTGFDTPARTIPGGTVQDLTWAVNNTDRPELSPTVDILLSADGGQTFDTVLATATANDGRETVSVPNVSSEHVRIMIRSVGNYFFAVSPADLVVAHTDGAPTTVDDARQTDPASLSVGAGSTPTTTADRAPQTVTAHVRDQIFDVPVSWDFSSVSDTALATPSVITVPGTATVGERTLPAVLHVLVTEPAQRDFAPDTGVTASATDTEPGYAPDGTRNGDLYDKGWSNWSPDAVSATSTLQYEFDRPHDVTGTNVRFFHDGTTSWADDVSIEARGVNGTWTAVPDQSDVPVIVPEDGSAPVVRRSFPPVLATGLRVVMNASTYLTVSEVEIFEPSATPTSLSALAALRLDDVDLAGFTSETTDYAATSDGSAFPYLLGVGLDRAAAVAIVQPTAENGAVGTVTVTSADGSTETVYSVTVTRRAVITGVTLSGQAAVGSVLTASATVNPSDAALAYEWLVDGTVAGSGAQWTVPEGAAGRTVSVRATATQSGFADSIRVASNGVAIAVPTIEGNPGPTIGTTPGGTAASGTSGSSPSRGGSLARTGTDGSAALQLGMAAVLAGALGSIFAVRRRRA